MGMMKGWGILWLPGYRVFLGEDASLAEAWPVAKGMATDVVEGSWVKPVPAPRLPLFE